MGTKKFWKDTGERAVKTFAQTAAALITVGNSVWDFDWGEIFGVSATAGLVSVLTSIGSARVGNKESASLVQ